jgi:hypothetical protein
MAEKKRLDETATKVVETFLLWQIDVVELTGHNLKARGREEVNRLLEVEWRHLHIYMLKYGASVQWQFWAD